MNRPDLRALGLNLAVAMGGAFFVNALIFGLGWNARPAGANDQAASFAPPDWVIGAVWTLVLLPLAAFARWRMNAHSAYPPARFLRGGITLLLVSCLVYPLYSLAIGSAVGGLLGNLGTMALAGYLVMRLPRWSAPAALAIAPMVFWLLFATAIILRELRWL